MFEKMFESRMFVVDKLIRCIDQGSDWASAVPTRNIKMLGEVTCHPVRNSGALPFFECSIDRFEKSALAGEQAAVL
jgi:hypothetical protein